MTEHNIDRIFKEKLAQTSFSFASDATIASMYSALLKRKRLLLLRKWGSLSGIVIILVTTVFFIPNKDTTSIHSAPQSLSSPSDRVSAIHHQDLSDTHSNNSSSDQHFNPSTPLSSNSAKKPLNALTNVSDFTISAARAQENILVEITDKLVSDGPYDIAIMAGLSPDLSILAASPSFDPAESRMPRMHSRNTFSVYGGLNLSQSAYSPQTGLRVLGTAGFEYGYRINSLFSIHTGLAWRVSDGRGLKRESSYVEYGFGKTQISEQHLTAEMHFTDLPLDLRITTTKLGYAYAGLRVSYLANVRSQVVIRKENSLESTKEEHTSSWGDKSRFNDWNGGFRLGYGYSVTKSLSIEALADVSATPDLRKMSRNRKISPEYRVVLKYTPIKF